MKQVALFFLLLSVFSLPVHAQDYILGDGDSVSISVHQYPDLDTKTRVGEDGSINFPLLGSVKIGGLSAEDAARFIESSLKKGSFIKSPQVNVNIDEYRSQTVSLLGNVPKPGKYPIMGGSTILEIIAEAGGIAKDGSPRVMITRKGEKPFVIDTSLALERGDMTQNIKVISGDIIFVPRMEVFYIYGEVNRPGEYQLQPGMNIMQAISVGGGLTDKATERGLKIKRKTADGKVETISASTSEALQPDDVVYVKESLF